MAVGLTTHKPETGRHHCLRGCSDDAMGGPT
jgi:hypothetical protein